MKKMILTELGGHPATLNDLDFLQKANLDQFSMILNGLAESGDLGYILAGCEIYLDGGTGTDGTNGVTGATGSTGATGPTGGSTNIYNADGTITGPRLLQTIGQAFRILDSIPSNNLSLSFHSYVDEYLPLHVMQIGAVVDNLQISAQYRTELDTSNNKIMMLYGLKPTGIGDYLEDFQGVKINSKALKIQLDNRIYVTYDSLVGAFQQRLVQKSGTVLNGYVCAVVRYKAGDDFSNIGGSNTDYDVFVASGTTPTTWTNGSLVGVFETVTTDLGATGNFVVDAGGEFIIENTGGDWGNSTYITGDYSGATCKIVSIDFPEIEIVDGDGCRAFDMHPQEQSVQLGYDTTCHQLSQTWLNGHGIMVPSFAGVGQQTVMTDNNGALHVRPSEDLLPYYVYTALITQSDSDAPTATVLTNTFPGVPVWSWDDIGHYSLSLSLAFTLDKTFVQITASDSELHDISYFVYANELGGSDQNHIELWIENGAGGVDGWLHKTPFEVRVYK